jgi:hypothetical protein
MPVRGRSAARGIVFNSTGYLCTPPRNGEKFYDKFIIPSLVEFASWFQADRSGFASETAPAAPSSGDA